MPFCLQRGRKNKERKATIHAASKQEGKHAHCEHMLFTYSKRHYYIIIHPSVLVCFFFFFLFSPNDIGAFHRHTSHHHRDEGDEHSACPSLRQFLQVRFCLPACFLFLTRKDQREEREKNSGAACQERRRKKTASLIAGEIFHYQSRTNFKVLFTLLCIGTPVIACLA